MSENHQLNVTEVHFEKLRCSLCTGYLSCAPIRLLPDGNNICGRCSPNDDVLTYRQLTLEAILIEAEFPCKFKNFGCKTLLKFGHGTNHEDICQFLAFLCNSSLPCDWQGPFMQIPQHYVDAHKELVKNTAEFMFNIENCVKDIMMIVDENESFFITYEYDEETFNLSYSIRYFIENVEEVISKIRLTNEADEDYFLQLKGGNCIAFDTFTSEDNIILNINKYLDILNNPKNIKVQFSIVTIKSDVDNSVDNLKELKVNYEILEKLRCSGCQYYLVPPIFYLRPNIICCECSRMSRNCPPARNLRIHDLIAEANYPCRWTECNFVAKSDAIREHEINCIYRMYRCVISGCSNTFKADSIIEHLKNHDCDYFKEKIAYLINLKDTFKDLQAFTILEKEIVLIKCSTTTFTCCENAHYISIQTSAFNQLQFRGTVRFGHTHCKVKSKKFSFNNILTVRFSDLPHCFEIDEDMTVYLTIV